MLSIKDTTKRVKDAYPKSKILNKADFQNRSVFQINLNLIGEEAFPVFLSVDKKTSVITDISMLDDPDRAEIARQFMRKE